MANETQYINPIIQSMMVAIQRKQERDRLQQEADQFKETQGIRQHQLKLEEVRQKNEAEHQKGMLDIASRNLEDQLKMNALNRRKSLRDLVLGGVNPQTLGPEAEGLNQQQLAEDESGRIRAMAMAQSGGAAAGTELYKIAEEGRALAGKKELMKLEHENNVSLTKLKSDTEKDLAKMHIDAQKEIAKAANGMHWEIANLQYGITPDVFKALIVGGMTGEIKLSPANPIERKALGAIESIGGRLSDPNELKALKESQKLIPIFDKLQAFVNKLPETKKEALAQGWAVDLAGKFKWPTDVANELKILKSQALNIGRSLEGLTGGRVLAKQLEVDLDSITEAGIPKPQGQERLDNLKDLYTNTQHNVVMGGMPNFQKELIFKKYGIQPAGQVTDTSDVGKPKTGGTIVNKFGEFRNAHKIGDRIIGVKNGKIYYTDTGEEYKEEKK